MSFELLSLGRTAAPRVLLLLLLYKYNRRDNIDYVCVCDMNRQLLSVCESKGWVACEDDGPGFSIHPVHGSRRAVSNK